jgi:hypothetical protein
VNTKDLLKQQAEHLPQFTERWRQPREARGLSADEAAYRDYRLVVDFRFPGKGGRQPR